MQGFQEPIGSISNRLDASTGITVAQVSGNGFMLAMPLVVPANLFVGCHVSRIPSHRVIMISIDYVSIQGVPTGIVGVASRTIKKAIYVQEAFFVDCTLT